MAFGRDGGVSESGREPLRSRESTPLGGGAARVRVRALVFLQIPRGESERGGRFCKLGRGLRGEPLSEFSLPSECTPCDLMPFVSRGVGPCAAKDRTASAAGRKERRLSDYNDSDSGTIENTRSCDGFRRSPADSRVIASRRHPRSNSASFLADLGRRGGGRPRTL